MNNTLYQLIVYFILLKIKKISKLLVSKYLQIYKTQLQFFIIYQSVL